MMIETRYTKAATAAKELKELYLDHGNDKMTLAVRSLGSNPEPNEIDKIMGNESWTRCRCNECSNYVGAVIRLGEYPDDESRTAWICRNCIKKAIVAFENYER